jgi:hypothetical protein
MDDMESERKARGKLNQLDQDNLARMFFTKLHALPVPVLLHLQYFAEQDPTADPASWKQQLPRRSGRL